jgi:enamine deaminase RidA (YjgF/YER057c/UK114 family)
MSDGAAPARFSNPSAMPRPYGYSQVVQVTGGHPVYISGQVPLDTDNQVVGVGDFAAQARQAFENVRLALESVGLTFAHVVKIQMFRTQEHPQVASSLQSAACDRWPRLSPSH